MKSMKKKKKRAFTLIELLAVIVILAIIALIATPLVLKYIERAKSDSKVTSTHGYVRSLEMLLANYSLENDGKNYPSSGAVALKDLGFEVKVNGESPDDGLVCLEKGLQVTKGVFQYEDGKYYVIYDGQNASITDKDTYDNFSCSGNASEPGPVEIIWDGNIEGRIVVDVAGGLYYLISEYVPTAEELSNVNVIFSNGEEMTDSLEDFGGIYLSNFYDTPTDQTAYFVMLNDGTELDGIVFPKAGIYSIKANFNSGELFYTTYMKFVK